MGKELKDYLHLYLGSMVTHKKHGGKYAVCGMNLNSGFIQNIANKETFLIEDCKLILRPLSDMTEEEKKEFFKLQYGEDEKYNERLVKFLMSGKSGTYTLFPETFLYLLSKSFDLFGLIESGLAIKPSQL